MSHPPFGVLDREGVVHVLRRAHEAYADYDADQSDENYQKAIDAGEAYSRAVENYTSHQTPKPTPAPGAPPAPEEPAAVVPRRFRREGVGQPHPEWAAEMAAPAGQPPLVVGPDGKLMSSAHDTTPTARPLVVSPGDTRVYGESSPLEPPAAPAPGEPGWRLPKATAEAIFGRAPLEQAAEGAIADAVKTHPRPLPTIPQRRTMAREAGQPFRLGGPTGEQTVRAQTEEDVQGDLARAEAARGERVGEEVRANPEAAPWIFAREMGRHVVRGAGHRLPGLLRAVIRAAPQTPEAARAAGIPYVEPDVRGRLSEALDREIARGQAEESGAGPVGRQARELLPFLAALAPVEAAVPAVRAVSPAARLMERLLGGALRIGRTGAVVGGASGLETAATGGGPADVARATAGGFAVGAGFGVAGEAWGAAVQKVRSLLAGKDLATWAGPEEPLIHAARASGFRNGSPEQLDAAYATLGLDPETATAEQVKTARRTMAVRFAPRTQAQAADPLVSARMTTINAAHDAVVEDLARRRPVAPAPAPPPARPAEAPTAAAAPTPPRPAYPPPAAGETLQEWLAKLPPEARTAEAITSATEAIRAQGGGRVAPEARPAWEAAVEGYAAPAAPVPGDFRAAARPGDVAAVPEPQMPGRALHDVEGHPIPGTEQAIGLPAGQPERRTRPVNLPPVGMAERRAVPAPLITPEQLTQHGAAPAPAQITRMKVSDIEMDPARFQFRDVGPEGVTGELRGISKWNKYMGGVISVWRDPANGRVYVVNGHNRVDAARRLGVQELNVQFLDQPTAAEARSEGALINIGEGRATPLDVAKVMRDRKLTVEDINSRGISVRSELARAGGNLSRLAPDLFDQVAVGKISTSTGSAIGEAIPGDPALQREAMSIIRASGKRLTEAEAREVAAQVRDAATTDVTQQTLFGTETERVGLYVPKAQLVTALRRRLNADKRLFGYVSKEGRAEELARAGSTKVDVEAARQLATASSQVEELFNRLYRYSGPVSEQVTEGAGRIANGAKPAIVAADLYPAIFGAVQSEIARGGEVRGPGTAEPEVAAGAGAPSAAGEEEYPEGVVPDSTDPDQSALFERPKPYTPTPEDQQVLAQARSRLADLEAQLQAGWDRVQSRSQHAGDYMAGPFTEPGGADYNTLRDTWVNSPQYRALKAAIQRAGAEVKRLSTPKAPTRLKLSGRMMDLPTASAVTLPSDPYVRLDQISDSELAKMRQLVDWVDDPKQTEALSAEQVMTFRADRTALQNEINRRAGGVAERTKAYSPETVAQGNLFGSNEDITGPTGTRDLFPEDREIPGAAQTTEEAKATVLRKLKPGEAMGPRLGLTTGETEPAELPGERPLTLLEQTVPYAPARTEGPLLSAVHNLTAENLAASDKLGGFPAPSLAIVPENVPHTQYGEITLIGKGDLVEPSATPIFSADAYTGRAVMPEYPKVPTRNVERFMKRIRELAGVESKISDVYGVWDNMVNHPRPSESIMELERSATGAAAFLRSHGLEPVVALTTKSMERIKRFATAEALRHQIEKADLRTDFAKWTHDQVMAEMAAPFVRVRGRKMPYTLENVVAASPKGRAKEHGLTYGPGTARAAASKRFTDLEQMRRAAAEGVLPRTEVDAARKEIEKRDEEWRGAVVDYYTGKTWDDRPDTWNGLDAVYRALGRWAKGAKTQANLRIQLFREGFAGVPDELLTEGVAVGKAIMSSPVPYFEGKPTRGVQFDEFAGAVIPEDASPETRAILERRGIPVRTYKTPEEREAITTRFRTELDQGAGRTLREEQAPYTGTPAEDQLRAVQGALQKGEQTDAVRGATKRIDRALAGLAGEPDPLGDTPSSHIKNAMQVLSFADQLGEGTPEGKAALEQLRNALRDPRITPPHGVGEGGVAEQKEPLGATEYGGKPERAPLLPRMSYRAPKAGTAEAQQMELVFGNAAAHGQAAKLGLEANRVPTFDERRAVIPTGGRMSVDVVGKRIAGAQDIATVGRPFRSPQTETLGAMLAGDDDTVLHLETMTSGAIGHVDIPMERVGDALLPMPLARTIAARVNVTGATKVKLLHNHPSGNVKPSLEDRAITEKLDKALKHLGVKMEVEHYVIDHHTVSVIRIGKDGKAEVEENVAVEPPAGEARPDWTDVRGPELNTPSAVAAVAGHVPDHEMHVYYRDNAGRAVAMVPHRKSARGDIGTWLTREMHDVGAVGAIIVTPGNDAVLWRDLATDGRVAALGVLDVVGLDPRSGVYDSANARGLIGARPFGRGVGEATASYGGPGKPPVPLGRGAGEPVSGAGAGAGRPPEANPAELFSAVPAGEDLGDLARALGEETDPIKRRALIERVGRIYASIRKGRGPDPDINPTDYLNIERMDPADLNRPILEDEIRRSAERMYPEGRPAKGFNEALAEAQKIAADPRRLAGIPAERMSGTERLAERLLASAEIARHGGLLRRLADPTLRDAEREAIEQALAASDVRLHARIGRMMKAGTAQGRDLAYNRILANQTLDPATWLLRAQRVRGDVLTPAMREKILGMLERGEIDQLAQYVSQLREASTSRKIARYAKTNMISALTTIARIFTGSQFDLWMQLAGPGRLGELMADRVVRGMTKVETRSMLTGMRDVAIRQGAKQLVEEWGKIIRGEPVTGRSDVWGLGEFTNVPAEPMPGRMGQIHYKMMEALDTYEHAITRTHMGTHRLGWAPTYQKSLAEQSLLVARESLTVKGVRPKPSEPSVQQKARPLFAHPTDEMQNIAIEEARLATYLNRNAIADAVNALKRKLATAELPGRGMPAHAVNVGARALYLATEMTLPFAQISTNLIARGLETTPLGMATSGIAFGRLAAAVSHGLPKSEVEALQREFTRRAGRFTTGALLTLLGLYLYYRGRLIGYGPKDRGGKQAMRDQGASEFSIKIGDHWWSLSALGPLMMALGGAAAIGEVFDDPQLSGGKRALAAATGAIGVGARESLLRGLQTGAKAIGEPLTAGVQWAESAASAMIPAGNFLAKIAQASDPWQRRPHTFTQSIESRIPGARLAVPKATGRFGEPLPGTRTLGEVFSAIANPFLWRPDVTAGNPVLAEVARVKASVPTPKHRKGQSEDDYHEMLGRVGAAMLAKVQAEIASGEYGSASTEDQKYFLEREARAGEREVLRDVEADEPVKPTRQGERARRARTRRRR